MLDLDGKMLLVDTSALQRLRLKKQYFCGQHKTNDVLALKAASLTMCKYHNITMLLAVIWNSIKLTCHSRN